MSPTSSNPETTESTIDADQDRDQPTGQADVCTVADAIDVIGSEWRLVVLHTLTDGEHRFNELEAATGAQSRTLSRVLDDLEAADLVDRRVEDDPIATYYSLTDRGQALCPVFDELETWATEWL